MSDWQEQQHQDDLLRQQAALEALREARKAGVSDDKLMVLAYECGIANDFYKELKT